MAGWCISIWMSSGGDCLLNGLDDIGLTMEKSPSIDTYERKLAESRPWA